MPDTEETTTPESTETMLDRHKREIGERIEQLRPYVDEHSRLEAALEALDAGPRKRRGRPPKAA